MSNQNFDLFHSALKNYNSLQIVQDRKEDKKVECVHANVETRTGIATCVSCGEILKKNVLHEKEWRNYSDQKKDPIEKERGPQYSQGCRGIGVFQESDKYG